MIRFHQCWQMYPLLPMKAVSRLPDEGMEERLVQIGWDLKTGAPFRAMVYIKPRPAPGVRWGHRVITICPDCGKHVPFGRMNQHWPVHFEEGR